MVPLQLLVIGRPKSGKSSLAKAIAAKYNLVLVSFEKMVEKLFEKVKFFEENPPETDEDGNPKEGLLPIEKYVLNELQKGNAVDDEDMLDLLNNELEK
jgi:shikimate kinase